MEQLLQDLTFAARMLRRKPLFASVALATLAIGLGANIAIFSVVNAVLLRPLPYAAPDRLFAVEGMSYTGEFVELQRRARTFDVAAWQTLQATLTGGGEPLRLAAASVSSNTVSLLGARPLLGRPILPGDERSTEGAVVLLGHELWRGRFGGDPAAVGRRMTIDGTPRTIVGVMGPDFAFPSPGTQLWLPADIDTADRIGLWSTSRRMIGRLRAGATLADAEAEVRAIAPALRELFPWQMPPDYGTGADIVPLHEALVGETRPLLLMLLGAVAVVLLIACVNVGNLLVVRTLARQRELAIRASLGAARGRLLRQVLTEGALLVGLGVLVSVPVAYVAVTALTASLPADLPRPVLLQLDVRLLAFAAGAAAASILVVAVVPAVRASRVDLVPRLSEGERTGQGRRTRRASNVLMGAQVALAIVLTVSAVLLVRTLGNLHAKAPAFATDAIVSARLAPPAFRYADPAARREFYRAVLERLQGRPGVTAVALSDRLPFAGEAYGGVFIIEGRPNPAQTGEWPIVDVSATVTPSFFATLDLPLLDGRPFTADDTETSQRVAIVSETLARTYWPGESPIGRRFGFPGDRAGMRTIVGVVPDVRWERVTGDPQSALFMPFTQRDAEAMRLVARGTGAGAALAAHIRSAVQAVDGDTPVDQVRTLRDLVAASVEQPRFAAALIAAFALAGLLLGGIGIYGTVADQVAQRRREIGVRMALGARGHDVVRAVIGTTASVVVVGVVAGLAAAALVTRLFASLLFGVTPGDPLTFAAAAALLALTALLGAWLPARRAAALDPLIALRE